MSCDMVTRTTTLQFSYNTYKETHTLDNVIVLYVGLMASCMCTVCILQATKSYQKLSFLPQMTKSSNEANQTHCVSLSPPPPPPQLRSVNESLNEYVSSMSTPATALYHTLQRHNEILQDYSQEFSRTKVGRDCL